jgi:acyl dehydratase
MATPKPVDKMEVGEELEPLEFVVTPELNQQYLYAEEDYHPRYYEESEDGPPLVHPTVLLNMSNTTRSPSFTLSPGLGAIHAGEETVFVSPARVGTCLRVTWKILEVFEKRGRVYHVREARIVDGDGREVLRRKLTGTFSSGKTS